MKFTGKHWGRVEVSEKVSISKAPAYSQYGITHMYFTIPSGRAVSQYKHSNN